MNWYEDIELDRPIELGSRHFSAEAIIEFARQFDPQPFHLDEAAAAKGLFGRLAASGWHTASSWMRLYVEAGRRFAAEARARGEEPAELGPSPGFENMRWLKPVLAGDTVRYTITPVAKRVTASRPGWGLVTFLSEGFDQNGDKVFEFTGPVFCKRRAG